MSYAQTQFKVAEIAVTNILDTGTSFAVVLGDTSEQAFIPAGIYERVAFNHGDILQARMIPNRAHVEDPNKAKWMVIHVTPAPEFMGNPQEQEEVSAPAQNDEPTPETVVEVLREDKGLLWTAQDMATELWGAKYTDTQRTWCRDTMIRLNKKGRIARTRVYTAGSNTRASHDLFSYDATAATDHRVQFDD